MIERLENSIKVSEQVSIAMKESKKVEKEIAESSYAYSQAAIWCSLIFFLFKEL